MSPRDNARDLVLAHIAANLAIIATTTTTRPDAAKSAQELISAANELVRHVESDVLPSTPARATEGKAS